MNNGIINKAIKVLKKKFRILLISGLMCSVIVYLVYFLFAGVEYEAISRIFVGKEKYVSSNSNYSSEEITFYQRVLATFKEISKSNELLNATIKNSGIDIKEEDLSKSLTTNVINRTQLMEFKIISKNADDAYELLYSYVNEFINTSKTYFKNSDIYVIEQPYVRVANNKRDILLMIFASFSIGMLISGAVLIYKSLVFNTIYNKENLEELTTVSCLGIIPDDI